MSSAAAAEKLAETLLKTFKGVGFLHWLAWHSLLVELFSRIVHLDLFGLKSSQIEHFLMKKNTSDIRQLCCNRDAE